MSFSVDDPNGFKNGYNLRFFNVKDCPKCKEKDSFTNCLMVHDDNVYSCDMCDHKEVFIVKELTDVKKYQEVIK